MPSTPEEAKARLERAFRVKFDREPERAREQTLILLAQDRIADGSSFRWEGTADNPELRFGTVDEEEETATENDLMQLEAEEAVRINEQLAVLDKQPKEESKGLDLPRLTDRETRFCRLIVSGMTQVNAYYSAGYKASSRTSAYSCASQIAARPHVSIYLRKLKESSYLADVLSFAEKRMTLRDVVRTPVGQIDENHPLAQEVRRKIFTDKDGNKTGEEVTVKMPSKLQALELDAKLAGELKESSGHGNSFTLNLIQQRMDLPSVVSGEYIQAETEEIPKQGELPE